ncbi:hypothetical protein HY346_03220 [Candidatus Microgenomates bacterium]|nr:hypothetical protein [Candidatus Microgenomates bacterium]
MLASALGPLDNNVKEMQDKFELKLNGPSSEVSREFLQGMVNRMMTSFRKYGLVAAAYPDHVDAVATLRDRLREYERTGRAELLIDVGNFAMIEYMYPRHEAVTYEASDSDKSAGRILPTGERSIADNERLATSDGS